MVQAVKFGGSKGALRGMLHLPQAGGPGPGVVIMHGFTGQRLESGFLFRALSRALETAGVASLRFDFYGSGESDGDFIDMTASSERADALAALDFFRSQDAIDAERVGMLGLSFGGFMTACTVGRRGDQVKAAVLWSAAGDSIKHKGEDLSEEDQRSLKERGWVDQSGLQLGRAFFGDIVQHDPYAEIAKYAGPVLVIHGTKDASVPLSHAEKYVGVLEARSKGATDHLFLQGADHVFLNWDHRQVIIPKTVDWFRAYL